MGGAPRNPAPRKHFVCVDCQTIKLLLHRCIRWTKTIVECRPPLGTLPLSLSNYVHKLMIGYSMVRQTLIVDLH